MYGCGFDGMSPTHDDNHDKHKRIQHTSNMPSRDDAHRGPLSTL